MSTAATHPQFPRLFAPGRIGTMELRNRLIMCPMGEGLANPDGTVSDTQINYYGARARGGVGLVIVGSAVVAYPQAAFAPNMTAISDPKYLPGLQALTRRAHEHGARIAAQLVHDGQYAVEDIVAGRPLLVPSAFRPPTPDRLSLMVTPEEKAARLAPFQKPTARIEYKVATDQDLAWVIERFVDAAFFAREAGFDGVELHAGHGYLIDSFLSPAMNRRTDHWGGSIENRSSLLCEIVRAIRARLGCGFPVWCRLNALERFVEGGETLADAIEVAKRAVEAGLDAIHLTINANPAMGITATAGHTPHEPGALLENAAAMKAGLGTPLIAFGRLSPQAAEQALADGKADFIAMGRKLLADAELPNKLAAGAIADIRPCIYQYRCIGNLYFRSSVSCVVNPATGHEQADCADVGRARSAGQPPRRLLVVGGGPSGMEAARLLAVGGDQVTLVEASELLGGMLAVAARADPDLRPLLDWLRHQVERSGIDLRLGHAVDPDLIRALRPDGIVLATGARWARPAVSGGDLPLVCTAKDEIWSAVPVAGHDRVVVIGGGKAGMSIASMVARRGGQVTILERRGIPAPELAFPARALWAHRLDQLGAKLVCDAELLRIEAAGVIWRSPPGGESFAPADLVVAADRIVPIDDPLGHAGFELPIYRIGECAGERFIEGAMRSAATAAKTIAEEIGGNG